MTRRLCTVVRVSDDYDVYIGRNPTYGDTYWGNPFRVGIDGTRAQCVAKYRAYVLNDAERRQRLHELVGKSLGCHCKAGSESSAPDKFCHGDILASLVNSLNNRSLFRRRT